MADIQTIVAAVQEAMSKQAAQPAAQVNISADGPPPAKKAYNDPMYKLTRAKCVMMFHFCQDCRQRMYNLQDTTVRNADNSVTVKLILCSKCVDENCKVTDMLAPYVPKKSS